MIYLREQANHAMSKAVSWHGIVSQLSESRQNRQNTRTGKNPNMIRSSSFQPGRSGNPGGRPKTEVDIAAMARVHGPKCIQVIVGMLTGEDQKLRLAAAVALLDRGFGRPKQEMDINSNSTIELHLVAARAISQTLIEQQSTPDIPTIESTSTDLPTE